MKPTEVRYLDSLEQFRAWMQVHHATSPPVWVALAKRGCSHHVLRHQDALDAALCWGWIDGAVGRLDDDHCALRFSRQRPGSNWRVVNLVRFCELRAAGQVHASGLAAFDSRDRVVSADVPAELDASDLQAFQANPTAWAFLQSQPPGCRRQASWYVLSARRGATRQRRLSQIIELSGLAQRLPGYG